MDKVRLGRFDKWGYKNSFSKGELARELVYMNEDYANLQHQLKRKDEVIDNIKSNIKNDIDGFITINDHGECNDIIELLEIYLQILEDKEVE